VKALHCVVGCVTKLCQELAPDLHEARHHTIVHEEVAAPLEWVAVLLRDWHAWVGGLHPDKASSTSATRSASQLSTLKLLLCPAISLTHFFSLKPLGPSEQEALTRT